jgi:hypothetical protein
MRPLDELEPRISELGMEERRFKVELCPSLQLLVL